MARLEGRLAWRLACSRHATQRSIAAGASVRRLLFRTGLFRTARSLASWTCVLPSLTAPTAVGCTLLRLAQVVAKQAPQCSESRAVCHRHACSQVQDNTFCLTLCAARYNQGMKVGRQAPCRVAACSSGPMARRHQPRCTACQASLFSF